MQKAPNRAQPSDPDYTPERPKSSMEEAVASDPSQHCGLPRMLGMMSGHWEAMNSLKERQRIERVRPPKRAALSAMDRDE
jgi:hypothetical protein